MPSAGQSGRSGHPTGSEQCNLASTSRFRSRRPAGRLATRMGTGWRATHPAIPAPSSTAPFGSDASTCPEGSTRRWSLGRRVLSALYWLARRRGSRTEIMRLVDGERGPDRTPQGGHRHREGRKPVERAKNAASQGPPPSRALGAGRGVGPERGCAGRSRDGRMGRPPPCAHSGREPSRWPARPEAAGRGEIALFRSCWMTRAPGQACGWH